MCALMHKPTSQAEEVLRHLFQKDVTINSRKQNRLGEVIKSMKLLNLRVDEKGEDESDIREKINALAETLQKKTDPNQRIIAYTDGSTETKRRSSKNSGYGISITTDAHTHIFNGGGVVRSDGNNFIAEMAAAAVVIHALPQDRNLTMYIDSMATIQALEEGAVSERRRIKMQGRAWKSSIG